MGAYLLSDLGGWPACLTGLARRGNAEINA